MKIICYGVVEGDVPCFRQAEQERKVEFILIPAPLNMENIHLAEGCDAVSVTVSSVVDAPQMEKIASFGIRFLLARSVGFNYIHLESAKKLGIRVANTLYSEHSVADFTLMLLLMTLRKAKYILAKANHFDYSVSGMCGREMPNLTVGVIGSGRIGKAVIGRIQGFGSKILVYDLYPQEDVKKIATYVSLETLMAESDVITIHAPATKENEHLISEKTLALMKDGVIIVNTARGDLVDSKALLQALASGKVAGAGLDTFEGELGLIRNDVGQAMQEETVLLLQAHPNVVLTPHVAYYTDQTRRDLVYQSLDNLFKMRDNLPGATEVTG